jgi:hypothetical protein
MRAVLLDERFDVPPGAMQALREVQAGLFGIDPMVVRAEPAVITSSPAIRRGPAAPRS